MDCPYIIIVAPMLSKPSPTHTYNVPYVTVRVHLKWLKANGITRYRWTWKGTLRLQDGGEDKTYNLDLKANTINYCSH